MPKENNCFLTNKKEIGGYIELEKYAGAHYHKNAIALNSGRDCLKYLIRLRNIQTIFLPDFICSAVVEACLSESVTIKRYQIGENFSLNFSNLNIKNDDYLYIVNYYGLLSGEILSSLYEKYPNRIIVDNAQAFFLQPPKGFDVIYTCRKFLGVPDGGYLYTYDDKRLQSKINIATSFNHTTHILGRFETNGTDYYPESTDNEKRLSNEKLSRMSKLTSNLLKPIDYQSVSKKRVNNWHHLHSKLKEFNRLNLPSSLKGPYMYPFMTEQGRKLKEFLIDNKIYIPTLWPNVLSEFSTKTWAYRFAEEIVPLPIDQRYDEMDMNIILALISEYYKITEKTRGVL